jgi:hypothetical protein
VVKIIIITSTIIDNMLLSGVLNKDLQCPQCKAKLKDNYQDISISLLQVISAGWVPKYLDDNGKITNWLCDCGATGEIIYGDRNKIQRLHCIYVEYK